MIKATTERIQKIVDSHILVKSHIVVSDKHGMRECNVYDCSVCGITLLVNINDNVLHGFNYQNLPRNIGNRIPKVFKSCKGVLMWKAIGV